MRSDLLNREVWVDTDLAAALPAVNGDRNQLQQVLLNLMMNGFDAMDTRPTDRRLRITTQGTAGRGRIQRGRPGLRHSAGGPGAHLRTLRDRQGAGHGPGTGHLPIDYRSAWRAALGHQQCGHRCHAALRTAGDPRLMPMEEPEATVYLVDDDPELRKAIERLLESAGMKVASFASAQQFLDSFDRHSPGCLVLDLAMPGLNGLQLQRELEQRASALPIVFLTGRGDIAASVQAMKHGASDFLTKPVDDTDCWPPSTGPGHRAPAASRQRERDASRGAWRH